jgi:hypothetical protein
VFQSIRLFHQMLKAGLRLKLFSGVCLFQFIRCFQQMLEAPSKLNADADGLPASAGSTLESYLRRVPFLRVRQVDANKGHADLAFQVRAGDTRYSIIVEAKRTGEPRAIREAVSNLASISAKRPNIYGMIFAPYISERSAEICRQNNVGYFDLCGNCFLSFDQIYIREKSDAKRSVIARRALRSIYSKKSARVLRVLLERPTTKWKLTDIARKAGVSLGQSSNVKTGLVNREWLRVDRDGMQLSDPEAVVRDWATVERTRKPRAHAFFSPDRLPEIERRLAGEASPCVLTEFSAASRIARGAVRYSRVSAYVRGDVEAVARQTGLKRVETGANVRLLEPPDSGVFYGSRLIGELNVVSPLQCYLDLSRVRGRGEEAADAVLNAMRESW